MFRLAITILFALGFTFTAAASWTAPVASGLMSQTPPAATPPAAAPKPVQDVARWTMKWLEKPVYTFLELAAGNRLITHTGAACPFYSTCSGGKFGLLGPDGEVALPPTGNRIKAIYKNGVVVVVDDQLGFLTWDGKMVLPPKYTGLIQHDESFFEVRSKDRGLQILGADGRVLIEGIEDVDFLLEKVILGQHDEKWGVYGPDGRRLLAHKFTDYLPVDDKTFAASVGERWMLIDEAGRQLTPLRYSGFNPAVSGLVVFNIGGECGSVAGACQGGRFGVMSVTGKVLLPAAYDCVEVYGIGEEDAEIRVGTAPADADPERDPSERCTGGRVRALKKDGTPRFLDSFAYLDPLDEAKLLRAVKDGVCDAEGECESGKWGVIDPTGKVILEYKYDWIDSLNERGTLFVVNKLWGFFDAGLKEVVPAKYELLHADSGALRFFENGKWGVLDPTGKVIVPARYDAILPFSDGVARFLDKGKWGLLSVEGKELVSPKYLAICSANRKTHLFATKGKCTIKVGKDAYASTIVAGGQKLRRTGMGGGDCECGSATFGLMDSRGKVLVQPKYQAIQVQTMSYLSERREGNSFVIGGLAALPAGQVWVRLNQGGTCPRIGTCTGGKWGIGDLKGRVIVPVSYPYLEPQANFLVRVAKEGTCEVSGWRPLKCSPETKWGLVRLEPGK